MKNIIINVLIIALHILAIGSAIDTLETLISLPVKPLDYSICILLVNATAYAAARCGISELRARRRAE